MFRLGLGEIERWAYRSAAIITIGGCIIGLFGFLTNWIDLRTTLEIALCGILVGLVIYIIIHRKFIRSVMKKSLNAAFASETFKIIEFHATCTILNESGDVRIDQPWKIIAAHDRFKSMILYFDPRRYTMIPRQLDVKVDKGKLERRKDLDMATSTREIFAYEYFFSEPVGQSPYNFRLQYKMLKHYPIDEPNDEPIHMTYPTDETGITIKIPEGYKIKNMYVLEANDIKERKKVKGEFTSLPDGFKWTYKKPQFRYFYVIHFEWGEK